MVRYWDQMAHQYSSMCTSFCSLGIFSEIGEWPAVSFTVILLDSHCFSLFSLSLDYLEAQILFHALLDIATSPDSPLRLKLISIIAIFFMPGCSVLQWGFTFLFYLAFCLNHVSGVSFRELYNKEGGKGTFRFKQDHPGTIIPIASHRYIKAIELSSKGHRKYR